MVIASQPVAAVGRRQLGQHAVLTLPKTGGSDWRLAVWETNEQRETGNRMNGWGAQFQVSGLGHRDPGAGNQVQVRVRVREICTLSPIQS